MTTITFINIVFYKLSYLKPITRGSSKGVVENKDWIVSFKPLSSTNARI